MEPPGERRVRVLLVDDNNLFREGLESLLTARGVKVLAAVGDGLQGLSLTQQLKPDILLLDTHSATLDGLSILHTVAASEPHTKVVFLSNSTDKQDLQAALDAGARGYLLKETTADQLLHSLTKVESGEVVVAPRMEEALTKAESPPAPSPAKQNPKPLGRLTPREVEVLTLLVEGQSSGVIARRLNVSDGTVRLHLKAILRALNVHSQVEAAALAVEHGLCE